LPTPRARDEIFCRGAFFLALRLAHRARVSAAQHSAQTLPLLDNVQRVKNTKMNISFSKTDDSLCVLLLLCAALQKILPRNFGLLPTRNIRGTQLC
jgi:hypothetical protein